jgi:hypothetical protein
MNDDLARSLDPCKQNAEQIETEITRIKTKIQTADDREQLRLLARQLSDALLRMDGLQKQEIPELHSPTPIFFQF